MSPIGYYDIMMTYFPKYTVFLITVHWKDSSRLRSVGSDITSSTDMHKRGGANTPEQIGFGRKS